ncbi:MAG: sensor histidine kinase [Planctomycetota bacterium]|jgi:signal transduction histidine kinase
MTWTKRSSRFALIGYLLVAGVVIGGLIWTTVVSLRLEHAEHEASAWKDHHQQLHLALSWMETRVQGTLIRETNRPAYQYTSYHYVTDAWDSRGHQFENWEVIRPSPLVGEELEEWLVLHFQVSPSQGWSSPQASLEELGFLVGFDQPASRWPQDAAEVLAALQRSLAPVQLDRMLTEARARDLANAPWMAPVEPTEETMTLASASVSGPAVVRPGEAGGALRAPSAHADYVQRKSLTDQALRSSQPDETCDPLDLALFNLRQHRRGTAPAIGEGDRAVHVAVTPSPMTAIWLRLGERGERFLAFVRTVPIEEENVYQGFLLDWQLLRARLLTDIGHLFPDADLVPVDSGPVEDRETLLTTLPAQLEASPAVAQATIGWTPMRSGLLLAWLAAATVLAAIGLGVRSLLALTERRTQFAYAVSHELRTPLTTFRLYTDMLAAGLVPDDSRDEYLQTINLESERLSQLVAGVLEYSRLEHHSVQLAPMDMTVGAILESARERFEPRCDQARRQLVIEANGIADQPWRTDPCG